MEALEKLLTQGYAATLKRGQGHAEPAIIPQSGTDPRVPVPVKRTFIKAD